MDCLSIQKTATWRKIVRFYMLVGRMEVFELTNAVWINQELDSFLRVVDQCVMLGRQWLSW